MISWVFLTCAALCCAWLLERCYTRRCRSLLAGLPGYPPLPLLGNLLKITVNTKLLYRLLLHISKVTEETKSAFVFWFGPFPCLVFSDPEDVKIITNTFIDKPYFYSFARVWLGDGLLTAPVPIWKQSIKKLSSAFSGNLVSGFQGVFNAQAHRLLGKLKTHAGAAPFEVMDRYLAYTTLEAICQIALGVTHVTEDLVTPEYYHAFKKTVDLLLARGINVFHHPAWLYQLTSSCRELRRHVAVLHKLSDTLIEKRKKYREEIKKNATLQNTTETENDRFKAYIDILLELNELDPTLTETKIRAEVDTIILGGQETVASILFLSLLVIGAKPEVQEKMYTELREIFGDSKREVEVTDLARMTYCEAVVSEVLRLYPPAPVVMRYADCDLQLKSFTVPKGAACVVNAFGAGRLKEVWGEDALEFNPERWTKGSPGNNASFLAFSYGKRACIGKRYAMAILKTTLAYCVRELVIVSQAHQLDFQLDIFLRPISENLIEVHLRQ